MGQNDCLCYVSTIVLGLCGGRRLLLGSNPLLGLLHVLRVHYNRCWRWATVVGSRCHIGIVRHHVVGIEAHGCVGIVLLWNVATISLVLIRTEHRLRHIRGHMIHCGDRGRRNGWRLWTSSAPRREPSTTSGSAPAAPVSIKLGRSAAVAASHGGEVASAVEAVIAAAELTGWWSPRPAAGTGGSRIF